MKGLISKISRKSLGIFPMLAMILASASVDSFCFYFAHQPDVPKELLNKAN